jgi:hypothetical protein
VDTARDFETLEPIEAEELWNLQIVDSNRYICRGCKQQVFPASFDKGKNKKRPYFRFGPLKDHLGECDVDGEAKIVRRATKQRVGTQEGYPMPFPNRLTLTDERIVEAPGLTAASVDSRVRTNTPKGNSQDVSRKHHGHTVKTIRTICRTYMKYPNDRPYMPLTVPGVDGKTYLQVFKSVRGKPQQLEHKTCLFYSPIRWTVEPIVTEAFCEFTLSAGDWDPLVRQFKSLYRVRVNWANWSASRRSCLLSEYEIARDEAKEQAKADNAVKGFLFFVGTQDSGEPALFHVEHHRLICSLTGVVELFTKK